MELSNSEHGGHSSPGVAGPFVNSSLLSILALLLLIAYPKSAKLQCHARINTYNISLDNILYQTPTLLYLTKTSNYSLWEERRLQPNKIINNYRMRYLILNRVVP